MIYLLMLRFTCGVLFTVLLTISLGSGSPVTTTVSQSDKWTRPCSGNSAIESTTIILQLPSSPGPKVNHKDTSFKLVLKAQDVHSRASILQNKYMLDRIQSQLLMNEINQQVPLIGFPRLDSLDPKAKFIDILLEDYTRASIIAAFVQVLKKDEHSSMHASSFHHEIATLESSIYQYLCQLEQAINAEYTGQRKYVKSDVVPTSSRAITSDADRSVRDFLILRDAMKLFSSMEKTYKTL